MSDSIQMIPAAPISTLRFALRAANGFTLDLLKIARGRRDFTDALILTALVQCNSAPLAGKPEMQRLYATFATPVPAEMRRAISVNAISTSLGLPFETVRRRSKRLTADGLCELTPQGLRFRDEALRSSEHRRILEQTYETVRSLYGRLKRADCIQLMHLPTDVEPRRRGAEPPVRIVWRAAADYFLRMMELLVPRIPNLSMAFIVLAVVRANTDRLSDAVRGEDALEVEAMVPDVYRQPARASDVAALLGLPHETVRRNLAALVENGRCVRVRGGFVVPSAVLARPAVMEAVTANFRNLNRMFADLAETGVLAAWDAEFAAEERAA